MLAIGVTLTGYRSGEKWSWHVFLAGSTIGWGSGLVFHGSGGMIPVVAVEAVVLLAVYIGLAMSAKAVLLSAPRY